MKNLLLLCIALLLLNSCNSDDNKPIDPISQLPLATQTGENTFGCILDGKPFVPGSGQNSLDCVYQFVNGGYYFSLQGNREINHNLIRLGCSTDNLQIEEGNTYTLTDNTNGNSYGKYFFETSINYTDNIYTGEMSITKFDVTNNIVSGTFWYDIEDQNGVIHEIREGRFDMQFTQ